jgi:beta-lactamase class D
MERDFYFNLFRLKNSSNLTFFMFRLFAFTFILFTAFSCTLNNVNHEEKLKKHFDEYHTVGSFAMYDNSLGKHTVYNEQRDTTRFSPAGTFNIVHSLLALQIGRLNSDSAIIKWDGVVRPEIEWNKDLNLYNAFRTSATPHFEQLAQMIGKDTLQSWMDTLSYGNKITGKNVTSFWKDGSLKISADEQIWLVKLLYFKQLPLRKSVQDQVKRMMIQENNMKYQLAYSLGWGKTDNGNEMGWAIGWIEENRHVYFFAQNFESTDHAIQMHEVNKKILNNILADLGFFKGKM